MNRTFLKFCIPRVNDGIRVYDDTGTEVSDSSQGAASHASPLFNETMSAVELSACSPDDTVILELVSSGSDSTLILDEDYSPSRKRQRMNEDAKHSVESALNKKPGGDRIITEYNRTKGLMASSIFPRERVVLCCKMFSEKKTSGYWLSSLVE